MPVLTRLIPSPVVVDIRAGALDELGGVLADQRVATSGSIAIAHSGGSGAALRERLAPGMPSADWYEVGGGTLDDAIDLADRVRKGTYDALVGLGGGKIIDVAKYAAARVGLPVVSVATNLAHDGICSPVSTLDNDAGRGSYGVPTPIAMIVDLDVIREAPVRYVRAGIGDVVSNLSACADWELAHRVTGEKTDGLAVAMARNASEALLSHPGTLADDAFLTSLAEALVMSGISMSIAGHSRPSSGACHEISHALVQLYPRRATSHGEEVGVGAAFATHLRGDRDSCLRIAGALHRHGLPVTAEQLGFELDEFTRAVRTAPRTRPGRYTILEHLDLTDDAIRDAYSDYVNTIQAVTG